MAYYVATPVPAFGRARSDTINANLAGIQAGFALLPTDTELKLGIANYIGIDTGVANAYVIALPYVPASYADGMEVVFKAVNANTGASTINVNALGPKNILRQDGSPLAAGDIPASKFTVLRYNATAGEFEMVNQIANLTSAAANSAAAAAASASAAANSATASANSATQAANSAASVGFTLTDLQTQGKTAFTTAGTAPAFTVTTNPAYGALVAGQRMRVKFNANGTTFSNTLNRDGLGAKNLMQYDSAGAKMPAVIAANMLADVEYDGTDMVVLEPLPSQYIGVASEMRNAAMTVSAASASATFTADEILVQSALGGKSYKLASYSKTINLATTGAGGMDTGTAPVSGYVALYAIYNPATGVSSILATNATSTAAPEIYGGANMPAGYTASALISVWPTNASSQFVVGSQQGREIGRVGVSVLSTSTQQASPIALSISSAVPLNAKKALIIGSISSNSASNNTLYIYGSSGNTWGTQIGAGGAPANFNCLGNAGFIQLTTPQTIYYQATASAGTMSASLAVNGYSF